MSWMSSDPVLPNILLDQAESRGRLAPPPVQIGRAETALLSRTRGALGDFVWRRFASLHVAVIGCGRTGSLVAHSLARLGVQPLTLIDPDVMEEHNVGEMDIVTLADLGIAKVRALAKGLSGFGSDPHSLVVSSTVLSLDALIGAKQADILICCADGPAHLATAVLAKLYLKPLLDFGTGIFARGASTSQSDRAFHREMGLDVRLVLPDRCLLCFGGTAQFDQARVALFAGQPDQQTTGPIEWRRQRAGSLRSLNQIAVGLGLRLLEDFVGGRVQESVWLHADFGDNGIPVLERRSPAAARHCPLCTLTGCGDKGLEQLSSVLEPTEEYREDLRG